MSIKIYKRLLFQGDIVEEQKGEKKISLKTVELKELQSSLILSLVRGRGREKRVSF